MWVRQWSVVAAVVVVLGLFAPSPSGASAGAPGGPGAPIAVGGGAAVPPGSELVPVDPVRIEDSRSATAPLPGAWTAGQTRDLDVTGTFGGVTVPADATAVVLNVTATGGTAASNLRLWPAGSSTPNVSNLNWEAGDTTPNLVIVKIGDDGLVSIRNQAGTVHVLVDLVGYHAPDGGRYTPVDPVRIQDSRDPPIGLDGEWGPGQTRNLVVTGPLVPSDATAVMINVTAAGGSASSNLRVWPTGKPVPNVSNLNWEPGDTTPNLVLVKLGTNGSISIRNQAGTVHVLADLVGYVGPSGDRVVPVEPVRIEDSRSGTAPLPGPWSGGETRVLDVTGPAASPGTVPDTATAVVLNVTATGGTAPSNLRLWPTGTPTPNVSNLNWEPGDTTPNLVVVKVGDGGRISIRNQAGGVHVLVDVVGYLRHPVTAIAVAHGCVLGDDVQRRCWGPGRPASEAIPFDADVVALDRGTTTLCVLHTDDIDCLGGNLGLPATLDASDLGGVPVAVGSGDDHQCVLLASGRVKCWGNNAEGQMGVGAGGPWWVDPLLVPGLTDATDIVVGQNHTCALRSTGTVACWGDNVWGQVGNGTTVDQFLAVPVSGLDHVVGLAASAGSTCAVRDDGSVWCWGAGTGGSVAQTTPVRIDGLADIETVSVSDRIGVGNGRGLLCAVDGSRRVWCVGDNTTGALGNGTFTSSDVPVEVAGLTDIVGVATDSPANARTACAWDRAGAVWCWGLLDGAAGAQQVIRTRPVPVVFRTE